MCMTMLVSAASVEDVATTNYAVLHHPISGFINAIIFIKIVRTVSKISK